MLKSLDYICKNVMIERKELNDTNYAYYLQLAANGARHLNLNFPINIKTIAIKYDRHLRYIDLPDDCIGYTKVGIIRDGRLVLLGLNKNMALQRHYDACGKLTPFPHAKFDLGLGDALGVDVGFAYLVGFYNYYYNGEFGALYGYGAGQNNYGEYIYDQELNRIEFSEHIHTDFIYLEYKSNGFQGDGSMLIPEELIEPLVEYVHWKISKFNTDQVYLKERTRKDFIAAKKMARRFNSPNFAEFFDYSFSNYTMAPK